MKIQEIHKKIKTLENELLTQVYLIPKNILQCQALITSGDFIFEGKIFSTLLDCELNGRNISAAFKEKNIRLDFLDSEISLRSVHYICRDLKDAVSSFRLFALLEKTLTEIPTENTGEFIADLQTKIINSAPLEKIESNISNLIGEFKEKQKEYTERFKNDPTGIIGIDTGYTKLNEITDGFRPDHLWIIGGYTNMGKTAASLNLVSNLIKQGKRVVYFSFEMGALDILTRLAGIMLNQQGMSGLGVLKGIPHDEEKIKSIFSLIEKSKLAIHTSPSESKQLSLSMYEEMYKNPVDLFVVDFIQLMTVKNASSEYEIITTAILELQQMAKKLKTPILVLSQINNESAKTVDSPIMGFKGSGAIAAAADLAIELINDEPSRNDLIDKMYKGEKVSIKWSVRKNRRGRVGFIPMRFSAVTGVFEYNDFL